MTKLINYAHRGASGYCPENTMAAFTKAIALGATGIETDIQMTKDGRLILIHDEMLTRTTGKDAAVVETDFSELRELDAGSWYSSDYQGEKIPTLEELIELVKPTDTLINIELKNGFVPYPGMEQKVINLVREYSMTERVIISSFNHYSLFTCKELAPDIRTGILYMEGLFQPWEYAQSLKADALHAAHYAVLPEWVIEASESGIIYNAFTVNEEKEMKRLIQAGVAGIITDYPDRLAALLS